MVSFIIITLPLLFSLRWCHQFRWAAMAGLLRLSVIPRSSVTTKWFGARWDPPPPILPYSTTGGSDRGDGGQVGEGKRKERRTGYTIHGPPPLPAWLSVCLSRWSQSFLCAKGLINRNKCFIISQIAQGNQTGGDRWTPFFLNWLWLDLYPI